MSNCWLTWVNVAACTSPSWAQLKRGMMVRSYTRLLRLMICLSRIAVEKNSWLRFKWLNHLLGQGNHYYIASRQRSILYLQKRLNIVSSLHHIRPRSFLCELFYLQLPLNLPWNGSSDLKLMSRDVASRNILYVWYVVHHIGTHLNLLQTPLMRRTEKLLVKINSNKYHITEAPIHYL